MSEAQECCIIGACCDRQKRVDRLASFIEADLGFSADDSERIARWIRKHYDLTPPGLIQPLIDVVAEMAREYPYET